MEQGRVCEEPKVAVDFAEFRPILDDLLNRIKSSIQLYGDWEDYDADGVFEMVAREFDEYREAYVAEDVNGPHGQANELFDLAVTAIKGLRKLVPYGESVPKPLAAGHGIKVGQYMICRAKNGKLVLSNAEGEAGRFEEADLEIAIAGFFAEHF